MNPDPTLDVDDVIADADDHRREYGGEEPPMWFSSTTYDGGRPMQIRRPEVIGDQLDSLFADLAGWVDWLVATYRLQSKIPPCWVRHPALVEEMLALFYLWQEAWIPATDPSLPVTFLRELDWSLTRIERHWKPSCETTRHKQPPTLDYRSTGVPHLRAWWSNPAFDESDLAVVDAAQGGAP